LHSFFSLPPPPPRSTLFPYTTLFRSQYTNVSCHNSHLLTFFDFISIFYKQGDRRRWIQQSKYSFKHPEPCNDTVFFADQFYFSFTPFSHHRIGSDVLACNIFLQCLHDQFICHQFHRNLIHLAFLTLSISSSTSSRYICGSLSFSF